MTIKEKIYRMFLLFIAVIRIYKRNIPLFWLKFILFIYAFTALLIQDYIGEVYRGDYPRSFLLWLPLVCLVMIEPLNQFTYYYAKKNRQKAINIKSIIFWLLFTIFFISDIFVRLQVEKTGEWIFSEKCSAVFILFLMSSISPWYSFCPDIRYLILVGKFRLCDKKPQTDEQEKVKDSIKQ